MSQQTHKRKRSLQDSPVDVSKFQQALNRLQSLKEELDGITETEAEIEEVMNHVYALETILKTAKLRKVTFSTISGIELERLGIESGVLEFHQSVRERLLNGEPSMFKDEMNDLTRSLKVIGDCVSMNYEVGARVYLDAILITLRKIALESSKDIAILPEFSLTPADGVRLVNKENGYEVTITGSVDYAVIKYERNEDSADRLLTPEGFRPVELVYEYAAGRLFLVEAKRQNGRTLLSFLPEAVSQAYVMAKTAKYGVTDPWLETHLLNLSAALKKYISAFLMA
ncbi:hypothetical protein HGRIS_014860 [Hohenbuehelia grisea]|uniref:Uncharacterized protein n=1 Tax=Hohenbuehelia grisea TaxID=104357 RepID=A0ABR3IR01_9AGAR